MYPGVAPAAMGPPSTVGTAMLSAGGATLGGAGFAVAPAPPAGALVDAAAPAAGASSRGHSSAVSAPATARITSTPARTSQRCRRRPAPGSGRPPYGGSGPPG